MNFTRQHQAMMARVDENLTRIHAALFQLQQLLSHARQQH
ncbi:hypothetical protein GCM10023095_01340 [Pseudaeromonas paramecii]|uniref:Uncharacterized protein n=1 Tax=Pseudaeromonas paramecii TaxID=2138166 RepID=A0ABP8PTJ5_9GAMM